MKKFIAILLILTLCLVLSACGEAASTVKPEDIVLPTRPEALESPTQPVWDNYKNSNPEPTEPIAPTEEPAPWEVEFNEADYDLFQISEQISYRIGGRNGREVRNIETRSDGIVLDIYLYPSGNMSHCYEYRPDGIFREVHCLDNGYTDENDVSHAGTCIYQKIVNPDGTWHEIHWNENGAIMRDITMSIDSIYEEVNYYENGKTRHTISSIPSADTYSEAEYYETGFVKRVVFQSSQLSQEDHYDRVGYQTYRYVNGAGFEIELISNEDGKLIKIIENGEVKEDEATLTEYARTHKFRP